MRSGWRERCIVDVVCKRAFPRLGAHQVVLHLELLKPAGAESGLGIWVIGRRRERLCLVPDGLV